MNVIQCSDVACWIVSLNQLNVSGEGGIGDHTLNSWQCILNRLNNCTTETYSHL